MRASRLTAGTLLGLALSTGAWCDAPAATFDATPIAPEEGVEIFHREIARSMLDRDLFSDPYASVVYGRIDLYEGFPYVESRMFQVVSDPGWNRLLAGESGSGLSAYDGSEGTFGRLNEPRGLALDPQGRLYVCDAGNHRVLVYQLENRFDSLRLTPLFSITGLSRPWGVAHSDAGTPDDPSDDRLYVAETGRNRVARFAADGERFTAAGSLGGLGSGVGRFAGPTALAVARQHGRNTDEIYVADAHNRRIVRLRDTGNALAWVGERASGEDVITSLDTDQWGSVYASCPGSNRVLKLSRSLEPVAELSDVRRPRDFHVPFVEVTDHRSGVRARSGQPAGLLLEEWSGTTGIRLYSLGLEVNDLSTEGSSVRFVVTDQAHVDAELREADGGRLLGRFDLGSREAGRYEVSLEGLEETARQAPQGSVLTLHARSAYESGPSAEASVQISGSAAAPSRLTLLGCTPNPFTSDTMIRCSVPAGVPQATVRIHDPAGRLVRSLSASAGVGGVVTCAWDGRDDAGRTVGSGLYLVRVAAGKEEQSAKLIRLH